VGIDEDTDVAVIKIKPERNLATAALGDSDKIRVGQFVIAIGNPFGLENTVTTGVVSAKGRQLDDRNGGQTARYTSFIQTDASINRGNSGGPLLNLRGEVIGINTMIFSPSGGSVGIGFAIPANVARRAMEELVGQGRIVRPQLGVAYQPVPPNVAKKLGLPAGTGMEVNGVLPGSAAGQAGLKKGDIILSINGKPLKEADDLRSEVQRRKVGDKVALGVFRKGKRTDIEVQLKKKPAQTKKAPGSGKQEAPSVGKVAWLGMTLGEMTEELARKLETEDASGAVVEDVDQESAAARSGIQPGDIVREVEQQSIAGLKDMEAARARIGNKDNILLLVERQGSTLYIVVSQEEKPAPE
jgi:serine protease Do